MKKLIIVRKGIQDPDLQGLSKEGKEDFDNFALKLKKFFAGRVLVICSEELCTIEAAQIIADFAKAETIRNNILKDEPLPYFNSIYSLIGELQEEADVLVFIMGFISSKYFPSLFFRKEWGIDITSGVLFFDQAIVIDIEKKEMEKV